MICLSCTSDNDAALAYSVHCLFTHAVMPAAQCSLTDITLCIHALVLCIHALPLQAIQEVVSKCMRCFMQSWVAFAFYCWYSVTTHLVDT